MHEDTWRTLQRVVEKANKLNSSRFTQQLAERGNKIVFSRFEAEVFRPDDEAIEAFVLTFRFFMVQNEATSFRALSKLIDDPEVSDNWKAAFQQARAGLNQFLDSHYGTYVIDGVPQSPTNREVLDVFLYGGLAHANQPVMVERFERWAETPFFDFLRMNFVSTLKAVLSIISFVAAISQQELASASANTDT